MILVEYGVDVRDIIEEFIIVIDVLSPGPVPIKLPTLSTAKLPDPTLFSRVRFWQAAQMKWSGLATQFAWCWRPHTQQPEKVREDMDLGFKENGNVSTYWRIEQEISTWQLHSYFFQTSFDNVRD